MKGVIIHSDFLVNQLVQGNQLAFTKLYDQYSKQLYRNIFRMVKDEDVAQELLQDLFMKIWEIRENIDPGKSFKSFLYKVAENLVYGHFRKVAKDARMLDRLILVSTELYSSAEDLMIKRESHELLNLAIEQLSPQRKRIYKLCKFEGKSYKEVSQELGITTAAVNSQIILANKAIRQYFYLNKNIAVLLVVSEMIRHIKL